jgi:hypothetical protein
MGLHQHCLGTCLGLSSPAAMSQFTKDIYNLQPTPTNETLQLKPIITPDGYLRMPVHA